MLRLLVICSCLLVLGENAGAASYCTRIGVTLPLTANLVAAGENFRNGIILAREQFDPAGKVEFIFEDDQFVPANTIAAVRHLIDNRKVCALIIFGTPTGLAAAPVVEKARIPTLVFSLFTQVMEGRAYVMKHFVSVERENEQIVREVRRRGYKRISIVASAHEAMLRLKDLFTREVREVAFSDDFPLQQDDFRPAISRILYLQTDAVYLLLFKHQGLFVKQLRRAGFHGEIFAAHNIEDPNEIMNAEGLMDSIWYANADDSAADEWYRTWENRFGSPPILGAMNGYDMAKLMIEGGCTQDLNYYLHTVKNFHGAFADYNASLDRGFEVPVALKLIRNGRFERM